MNITITRQKSEPTGTKGDLLVCNLAGKSFTCKTLELPWHDNHPDSSCIIADSYRATIWYSPHLDAEVVRLEDKHFRKDCLIHFGNFAGDVSQGFASDVEGCTLLGISYGELKNKSGVMQEGILHSRSALVSLLNFIGPGEHTVAYQWAEGCDPTA